MVSTYLYTHLWRHENGHIATEGICATSYEDACQRLTDYTGNWEAHHYGYEGTYIEHIPSGFIQKVALPEMNKL